MQTLKIGPYGRQINYFESNDEFAPEAKPFIEAYEAAAVFLFRAARLNTKDPNYRLESIAWFAVVETIQAALKMYLIDGPEEFDLDCVRSAISHIKKEK
jgi:hypothetical protein